MRIHLHLTIVGFLFACMSSLGLGGELSIHTACGGHGMAGMLSNGETTIKFESCADSAGLRSRIWKSDGSPMTEITQTDEGVTSAIAGIPTSRALSPGEEQIVRTLLASPEAKLATTLYDELARFGFDKSADVMRAVKVQSFLYESVEDEAGED